jgi:hypothetical protein
MRTQAYAGRGCQSFISEVVRQHQSRSNRQKARGNSLECFGCHRSRRAQQRRAWRTGNWLAQGRELTASSRVSPMAVQSQISSVAAKATVGGS